MNCREAESLVQAEHDGVLPPAQQAALAQHLGTCASCQRFRAELLAALAEMRAEAHAVRIPDIDAEWRAVQSQLEARPAAQRRPRRRVAPLLWMAAPLAAAAAVALMLVVHRSGPAPTIAPAAAIEVAQADYVELADPNATPLVYTDQDSGWLVVWAVENQPAPAHT